MLWGIFPPTDEVFRLLQILFLFVRGWSISREDCEPYPAKTT
nr:MAG TPA: hypothetical protein [Caudoviricetes sp.]